MTRAPTSGQDRPGGPHRSAVPRQRGGTAATDDLPGGVKSVVAALDVLDCFAEHDELGVSDIARRLGVAKSTAHRLLTSLCARGLAERNPESGQYRLGLHLFELGQLTAGRMRLRRTAMPLLEELRQLSGCTVDLGIASGPDVLYIARLETLPGIRMMAAVGRRLPSHCTAAGKAISAFDPAAEQARRTAGFPRYTKATIRTSAEYVRALTEVRRRGVAVNVGEFEPGIASIAAPVLDSTGRAICAISLVRGVKEMATELGRATQLVAVAAKRLARDLAV